MNSSHKAPPPQQIDFECQPQAFCDGRSFIEAWAHYAGFDDNDVGLIALACDEVFSNLRRHAYQNCEGPHPVSCSAYIENDRLGICIRHCGAGITDKEYEAFRLPPSTGERVGGLGLHVIGEVFDEVHHECGENECTVRLSKKLPNTVG